MSTQALVGNFVVAIAGRGLGIAIGVGTIGVLIRHLGGEDYGAYLIAFVFLTTVTTIANFGFANGQLHMMGRGEFEQARVVGGFVALRIIVGVSCLALAPAVVLLFDYSDEVNDLVVFGTVGFFFMYLSAALGPVFQTHLAMGRGSLAALADRITFLALVLGCVALGFRTRGVMVSLAVASGLALLLRLHFARSLVAIRPRFEPEVWKWAWTLGWPIAVMNVLSLLCTQGDLLLLGVFWGEAEVGLYGVPFRILTLLVTVLPISFMGLMVPQLSRTWFADDLESFRAYVQGAFDFLTVVLLCLLVATMARAEAIMVLIGGAELAPAGNILRIHMLAAAVTFFNQLYGHILLSTQRIHLLIAPTAAVCVLCGAAYFLLIPAQGAYGAAWSRVIHAVLFGVATLAILHPASRNAPRLGVPARAAVAAAVTWVAMTLLPPINVIVDLIVGVVVYAVMILVTGAVKPDQVRDTLATLRRRRAAD